MKKEQNRSIIITPTKESLEKVKEGGYKEVTVPRGSEKLRSVPIELCYLDLLEKLVLDNHEITTIPESLSRLQNLIELRLDNNCISSFPIHLQTLPQLRILSMQDNKLTEFPSFIDGFECLEYLNLSKNSIVFPHSLRKLPVLKTLILNGTLIGSTYTLSNEYFDGFYSLEYLAMMTRLPIELPITISNLKKLKILDISVYKLPDELSLLSNLEKLRIQTFYEPVIKDCPITNLLKLAPFSSIYPFLPLDDIDNLKIKLAIELNGSEIDLSNQSRYPDTIILNTVTLKFNNNELLYVDNYNVKKLNAFENGFIKIDNLSVNEVFLLDENYNLWEIAKGMVPYLKIINNQSITKSISYCNDTNFGKFFFSGIHSETGDLIESRISNGCLPLQSIYRGGRNINYYIDSTGELFGPEKDIMNFPPLIKVIGSESDLFFIGEDGTVWIYSNFTSSCTLNPNIGGIANLTKEYNLPPISNIFCFPKNMYFVCESGECYSYGSNIQGELGRESEVLIDKALFPPVLFITMTISKLEITVIIVDKDGELWQTTSKKIIDSKRVHSNQYIKKMNRNVNTLFTTSRIKSARK